jgi:hypothetical protein
MPHKSAPPSSVTPRRSLGRRQSFDPVILGSALGQDEEEVFPLSLGFAQQDTPFLAMHSIACHSLESPLILRAQQAARRALDDPARLFAFAFTARG